MNRPRLIHAVSCALLAIGLFLAWGITFVFTLYTAIFYLPLSLIESLLLGFTSPTRIRFRTLPGGLFLCFIIATLNQCIAGVWLIGYEFIKHWAYSTSSGDTISALYFLPSAIASIVLVYNLRQHFYRALA